MNRTAPILALLLAACRSSSPSTPPKPTNYWALHEQAWAKWMGHVEGMIGAVAAGQDHHPWFNAIERDQDEMWWAFSNAMRAEFPRPVLRTNEDIVDRTLPPVPMPMPAPEEPPPMPPE